MTFAYTHLCKNLEQNFLITAPESQTLSSCSWRNGDHLFALLPKIDVRIGYGLTQPNGVLLAMCPKQLFRGSENAKSSVAKQSSTKIRLDMC